jgi:hypothetical protein
VVKKKIEIGLGVKINRTDNSILHSTATSLKIMKGRSSTAAPP